MELNAVREDMAHLRQVIYRMQMEVLEAQQDLSQAYADYRRLELVLRQMQNRG
jgi:uncharacterized protein (DUF3084 family)